MRESPAGFLLSLSLSLCHLVAGITNALSIPLSAVPIDHIRGCRPQLYHERGAPAVAHGGDVVPLLGVKEQRVAHLRSGPGPGWGLQGALGLGQGSLGS